MQNAILQSAAPNTITYEQSAYIKPTGFREYDARWIFEKEINLYGIQAIGFGLGSLLHEREIRPDIIVAHDFRSYSQSIKQALIVGLMNSGCRVIDIGMAMTPMAYFAQFAYDAPAVAMVTASHNENGWTGIKMGMNRPLTFGPDEMLELKTLVLSGGGQQRPGGSVRREIGLYEKYKTALIKDGKLKRPLRVAVACGNGTAGAFAPDVLAAIGCDVVPIDCDLDFNFPNYNPNPEDLKMLHVMADAVKRHGCDLAFGFDGDGDRVGVVDNEGHEIFSDKLGVLIARDVAAVHPHARFVVDVKSTGLFKSDPVLQSLGATVDYWKTGHSYIKQRTQALDAVAGFEKSGHFFLRSPLGLGYDDGLASAILICRMLDRADNKPLAELYRGLATTYSTPTMSPHCDDLAKYGVVAKITEIIAEAQKSRQAIAGRNITSINTVNGVRFEFADGSFGLIRASSNKPELVVVCESVESRIHMHQIFDYIQSVLAQFPEIGAFNQKI